MTALDVYYHVELSCPRTSHLSSTPEPTTFFFVSSRTLFASCISKTGAQNSPLEKALDVKGHTASVSSLAEFTMLSCLVPEQVISHHSLNPQLFFWFSRNFDDSIFSFFQFSVFQGFSRAIFFGEEFPPLVCALVTKRWRRGGSPRTSAKAQQAARQADPTIDRAWDSKVNSKSSSFSMLVVV